MGTRRKESGQKEKEREAVKREVEGKEREKEGGFKVRGVKSLMKEIKEKEG